MQKNTEHNFLQAQVDKILKSHLRERNRARLRSFLSIAVVFFVVSKLLLPATALEFPTYCGLEEHVHTEECYTYATIEEARALIAKGAVIVEGMPEEEIGSKLPGGGSIPHDIAGGW